MKDMPFKTAAMIHSLQEKREVLVVHYKDNNHCRAVYGNKLCTAVYNPFAGCFYVDDLYGVIAEWTEE